MEKLQEVANNTNSPLKFKNLFDLFICFYWISIQRTSKVYSYCFASPLFRILFEIYDDSRKWEEQGPNLIMRQNIMEEFRDLSKKNATWNPEEVFKKATKLREGIIDKYQKEIAKENIEQVSTVNKKAYLKQWTYAKYFCFTEEEW